jgi:hypothetical protein
VRSSSVAKHQALIVEQTGGGEHRQMLGDLKRYAFVLGDRLAERVALLGVLDRLVERLLCGSDAAERDDRAVVIGAVMAG